MPRGAKNGLGKFPFRAARRFAWGGGIAKIDAALPHGQGGAEGLRSDAACLRQERCVAARSILRRYGVSASAPGNGEGFARFSFPHRFSFLPRGERRAPPAPAQGPLALENPLRCRACLATLHPRPLRASPPVGGARRALPAPAQGPSALENPLCCRVQAEVSRASPNPQRRQAPKPEPAVVAWPLRTIPKRNKAAPPPKRGAGPRRSFAVATGRRHCRPERGGRRCGRWLF